MTLILTTPPQYLNGTPDPRRTRRPWLAAQDARISRCPGCDDWQWDDNCRRCTNLTHELRRTA